MTHIEFKRYQGFHITFRLKNGVELSGILYNTLKEDEKTTHTTYAFIPTQNRMAWRDAEKIGDQEKMKSLTEKLDIEEIAAIERTHV